MIFHPDVRDISNQAVLMKITYVHLTNGEVSMPEVRAVTTVMYWITLVLATHTLKPGANLTNIYRQLFCTKVF